MVSQRIELFLNLLLPLFGGGMTFGLLQYIGGTHVANAELQSLITIISLLVAMALSVIPRHLIQAEIQDGIAHLKNGKFLFSEELTIRSLLHGEIKSWIPFNQPLHTSICIAGPHDWRYLDVSIERHITKNSKGKIIAANIDKLYPILEQRVQRLIYSASIVDPSYSEFFAENQLMNDEDIFTFMSKLLSTIESDTIPGIEYGFEVSSITVDQDSIRRVERKFGHGQDDSSILADNDDLEIDHLFEPGELEALAATDKNR